MLLSVLTSLCADRYRDPDHDVVLDAQWQSYVNQAYNEANGSSPLWPWLEAVTSSVTVPAASNTIALPGGAVQVLWAYDPATNSYLQADQPAGDWFRGRSLTSSGAPRFYRVRGTALEVFPSPVADTPLTVSVTTFPADMTASDAPVWPATFHKLLVDGALSRAYLDDGSTPQYQALDAVWKSGVADMLRTVLQARTDRAEPIRDRFFE